MNMHEYKAHVVLREKNIWWVKIVYNPSIQVLRAFADRNISLNGTFMKHKYGGVLLEASVKKSNNEI